MSELLIGRWKDDLLPRIHITEDLSEAKVLGGGVCDVTQGKLSVCLLEPYIGPGCQECRQLGRNSMDGSGRGCCRDCHDILAPVLRSTGGWR